MESQPAFTIDELNGAENWNLCGKKPTEVSMGKWQLAIELDVMEEYFGSHKHFPDEKAQERYNNQKGLIIKALKAIEFQTRPDVRTDKQGNIFVYWGYGENYWLVPSFDLQGDFGFIGNGNVCVLFAESNNLIVMHNKIKTEDAVIKTISWDEIDVAIKNNDRIKLPPINFLNS